MNIDPPDMPQPHLRCCDHPGCAGEGQFRAPRSRDQVESYFWFCLDHVRAYNAAWNYYAGMSEKEIEAHLRRDTVWDRPTWPLGWRTAANRQFKDPFRVFDAEAADPRPNARKRPQTPEEIALDVLDLEAPFTLVELKTRYKLLVKLHHPDAHGGDRAAEERLKVINQAYATLKASLAS